MKRVCAGALGLGAVMVCLLGAAYQPPPPDQDGPGRGRREGPPPRLNGDFPTPPLPPSPPGLPHGRFEPGRIMPQEVRDRLDLTDEQDQQVDQLEKEVKDKLMKILTTEQKKKLRDMRRQGPGLPPPPPGGGRFPGSPGRLQREGQRPGGPRPGGPPDAELPEPPSD